MKNIRILVSAAVTVIIFLVIILVGINYGAEGLFMIFFIGPLAIAAVVLIYCVIYTLLERPIEWFFKNRKRQ